MFSLFEIAPQCCDANGYLALGNQCAQGGMCYGELRPMGDYYWFSVPVRLGWPDSSLIIANILLIALSIFFSTLAVGKLLHVEKRRLLCYLGILPTSLIIHSYYFYPTVFHSLSDAPAAAMLLCGVSLLIIQFFSRPPKVLGALRLLFAGSFLGFSVWLRAFYLYPVLGLLFVYAISWLLSSKRQFIHLFVFSALVPLAIQYQTMFGVYGKYSFIKPALSDSWTATHLNSVITGYDTLVYNSGYQWRPRYCSASYGILDSLTKGNAASFFCVLGERLYFYLGTYQSQTYVLPSLKNYLSQREEHGIGDPKSYWSLNNLDWVSDESTGLEKKEKFDKLIVKVPKLNGSGSVSTVLELKGDMSYTFSVWAWSPLEKTINLAIVDAANGHLLVSRPVALTSVAQRYSVTGKTQKAGRYVFYIGDVPEKDLPITFGEAYGDFLFVAKPQVEEGVETRAYVAEEKVNPDDVRRWSWSLLCLNAAMLLLCLYVMVKNRAFWLQTGTGLGIVVLFLVMGVESISIIPEQRFAIAWMVFLWVIALSPILRRVVLRIESR